MPLDPIELELMSHKFKAVAEEMGIALARTARSSYVKETNDFGTALVDANGRYFAFPDIGVALGVDKDCSSVIGALPDIAPGDIIITNHPYLAPGVGSHLPDINLFKPYFHDGEIVCWGWNFVHFSDVGGGVPSSISPSFDNLFQEGFQIPPMKLVEAGVPNATFLALFRSNTRVPDVNDGDMKAQITALTIGERRVKELIDHHGIKTFKAAQSELVQYAKRRALDIQRRIPDGTYEFWDYMDDDFRTRIPVRLRCRMEVQDGHIHLDLTGTDTQLAAPYNLPTGGRRNPYFTTKLLHMLFTHDRGLPLNYGLLENVTVDVPQGTLMNPEHPAPVGVRHATAIRFNDAVLGCLAQADPGVAPAASGGTVIPAVVAQANITTGAQSVAVLQSLAGGGGATPRSDGADGRDRSLANILNTPTERGESDVNVRIEHYGLRPDSGGPGYHRGGTGVVFAIRVLQDDTQILGRGLERFVFSPWGAAQGRPGQPSRVVLNMGSNDARELGKIDVVKAREGDLVTILTPGGGGYGHPFDREIERVVRDIELGFVTPEAAESQYGVVMADARNANIEATAALRARRPDFPTIGLDPIRMRWEQLFDDASMTALNSVLLKVPAALRSGVRTQTFEAIVPGVTRGGAQLLLEEAFDFVGARRRMEEAIRTLSARWAA